MKKITTVLVGLVLFFLVQNLTAQEETYQKKIEALKEQKDKITQQEKKALKLEIEEINKRVERGSISKSEAETLKIEVAKNRALNIDNRLAIIDNKIELLERNDGVLLTDINNDSTLEDQVRIGIDINGKPAEEFIFSTKKWRKDLKYDRRTYSDFVMAIGLNNALIDDQSLDDSPYKIGGSRFFELGVQWRTRLFKNSNFMRLNYGFSFQFNGLKPDNNQFFVENGDQTELQEFDLELNNG
jgi:regulator of replication initiation timing